MTTIKKSEGKNVGENEENEELFQLSVYCVTIMQIGEKGLPQIERMLYHTIDILHPQ